MSNKDFNLSAAVQLLKNEIAWCRANPDDEESAEYQRGFVAGIGHVSLLLRSGVEVTGGDAKSREVDAFLLWAACAKAYEIMDHTEGIPDWKSKAMRVLANAIEGVSDEKLAASENEWIRIEHALPKRDERVIASNGKISTAAYYDRVDKVWRVEDHRLLTWTPTHWRRFGLSPIDKDTP